MSVKLYVEGGGDRNKALQTECRRGFSELIRKSGLGGRMPRVVACGGRQRAYESFRNAHNRQSVDGTPILAVDSEGPVQTADPWEHVRNRSGDRWERPTSASEDQLQLMVQTMESWFHADRAALQKFYGQGFRASELSARRDIESIPKADLFSGLRAATAHTQKGEYSKGDHSFQILARIDPAQVRAASPEWCGRLLRTLDRLCR